MDNRADAFVRKFSDAQNYLGSQSIQKIVSLKFRDNVGYSIYRELIDGYLNKEQNIKTEQLQGDFQGNAWLVTDKNGNEVI